MPLITRKSLLAVKIETTSGTAEALAGTDVLGNVFEPLIQPSLDPIERTQQGTFGMLADAMGTRMGTATFRTELTGNGLGTTPVLLEALFPACGYVQTLDAFNAVTEAPGANVKTLTMATYVDGLQKLLVGCAGTFVINSEAGKPVSIDWTFTGKWGGVTDVAVPTPSPALPTDLPLRFGSAAATIGAWAPCMQSCSIDIGNTVTMRECQQDVTGYAAAMVTDRKPTISINPEAALVSAADPYGDALAGTSAAFAYQVADATDTVDITAAAVQLITPAQGDRNGIVIDDLTYKVLNDGLILTWS